MTAREDIWPVYVINMAGSTTRLETCRAQLAGQGIGFQRFEAVNGRKLRPDEIASVYDAAANRRRFRYPLIGPEFGCYLSHVGIWRDMLERRLDGAIVLEDDFAAAPGLGDVLAGLSADQGNWDMVKLFSRRAGGRVIERRPLTAEFSLIRPYQIPNTTMGYALRGAAAAQLLARSLPFARPIDEDHKRFWEHGLSVWSVAPSPLDFGAEAEAGDTIGKARREGGATGALQHLRQGLKNLAYRAGYLAQLHYHRAMGR